MHVLHVSLEQRYSDEECMALQLEWGGWGTAVLQWVADSIQKEVSQAARQIQTSPCSQDN